MRRNALILLLFALLSFNLFASQDMPKNKEAYVIIIIDDFGNNLTGTKEILEMPIKLTGAVIPGMRYSAHDAKKLHESGKEVILHVPLEAECGKKEWLGDMGITTDMDEDQINEILGKAIKEIPYVKGMNNHMGSKAMKNELVVSQLMEFAKCNSLYFVDSKTTDDKLSKKLSLKSGVKFFTRDVFIDNQLSVYEAKKRLLELEKIAKEKGFAIGIGHVGKKGPYITQALKEMIPQMQERGIKFVTLTEFMEIKGYK